MNPTLDVNRFEARLWLLQRATAAMLALFVVVHLVTMILAVRGGLSAADVLGRTRGNPAWAGFYAVFVLAVSIHASIGLRAIAAEWLALRGRSGNIVCALIGLALLLLGARAVVAVTL